jgi:hypothetical protein
MMLDTYIPEYELHMYHAIVVDADPEQVYAATKELQAKEISWIVWFLLAVRDIPDKLFRKYTSNIVASKPFLSQMLEQGATLLEDSQDGIIIGMIGEFWKISGGCELKFSSKQEFVEFDKAEYATALGDFCFREENGKTVLSTETRVSVPNEKNRKKFAFYWRMIYWPSSWIRSLWLRAIKRRAERAGSST